MKYTDRKLCNLINSFDTTSDLRCPQLSKRRSLNGSNDCKGCELFEVYLRFKELSIEVKELEEE